MMFKTSKNMLMFLLFMLPLQAICNYEHFSIEKRLHICQDLRKALNVEQHTPYWWPITKVATSGFIGISTYYIMQELDNKNSMQLNKLGRIQTSIKQLRRSLDKDYQPETHSLNLLDQEINATKNIIICVALGMTSYLALSLFFDKKAISSHLTLKNFLHNWPEYSMIAPPKICQEVRPLYAAYLKKGVAALPDEKTSSLICFAFTVFLIEEIEALARSLSF